MKTLKQLYPRTTRIKPASTLSPRFSGQDCCFEVIEGPYGYLSLTNQGQGLDVVVDVNSQRLLKRTANILDNPFYTLCSDGEYTFRLNFSEKQKALRLIGIPVDRRG